MTRRGASKVGRCLAEMAVSLIENKLFQYKTDLTTRALLSKSSSSYTLCKFSPQNTAQNTLDCLQYYFWKRPDDRQASETNDV